MYGSGLCTAVGPASTAEALTCGPPKKLAVPDVHADRGTPWTETRVAAISSRSAVPGCIVARSVGVAFCVDEWLAYL